MYEIDGPPFYKFCWEDPREGKKELRYKTLAMRSHDPIKIVSIFDFITHSIRTVRPTGILFWRRRPELTQDLDTGCFTLSCRLAVWPEIGEEWWKDIGFVKAECEESKYV